VKDEYPYLVELPNGKETVAVEISKPTRTAKLSLKKVFAQMQADIGNAYREMPDAVEALKRCDGDMTKVLSVLDEMGREDMTLAARMAPLNVAVEEAQEKYVIHGFQAIVSLTHMTSRDMSLVMSKWTSPFWSQVDDLEPLVKAIDFFRSHAEQRSHALGTDDGGVGDLSQAAGAGEAVAQEIEEAKTDPDHGLDG